MSVDFTALTNRIMVVGIIALAGFALYSDPTKGQDLALVVVAGIVGLLNGDK